MAWKKHFRPVNSVLPVSQRTVDSTTGTTHMNKYNNWLPEVYAGPPDRLQRYSVYDQMMYDHEISAALDTLADFATDPDEITKLPFVIDYNDTPTATEIQILEKSLSQWVRINKMSRRLWRMFRSTLVYGDQFFIRDPETFVLYWIDPAKVEKVIVNESDGKKIESYFIKDIDLNIKNLVATNQLNKMSSQTIGVNSIVFSPPMQGNMNYISSGLGGAGSANYQDGGAAVVDAEHVLQISLTDGMGTSWPFGLSILEQIYKVFKQKELLEDAILIYRIHRAPERRVFFIDVGTMPPNKAAQYLERIKYEVQQKRIPSRTGGSANVVDSTYNPMCLDMSTKVPLLDGRILSISELADEYESGKENWVYSCDPVTGDIVPGNITWAGVTKKDAKVIKITLDNNETITCTPDHKIPVLGRGFVEAKDLTVKDPLVSFETQYKSMTRTKKDKYRTYQMVFNHERNEWVYTHRMVAEYLKGNLCKEYLFDEKYSDYTKDTVHHKDFVRLNNSPDKFKKWRDNHGIGLKKFYETGSDRALELKSQAALNLKKNKASNQTLIINQEILTRLVDLVKENDSDRIKTIELANNDIQLMTLIKNANPILKNSTGNVKADKFTNSKLIRIYKKFGYKNWKDFKRKISVYNHRIIKIEYLNDTMEVGTLTIDGKEQFHNHHTFALASGIFVKNSILEDYFFSVTSEGRGSKVEVLPGGENLGSIDDLRYFNNKMLRALGVPSSYLPTGPEDGTASMNDGKVGTAFIQEFRFSKVVTRYQQQIIEPLDDEFKLFLKYRGITIDNSLFQLNFTPAQSFSEYRQLELDSARINTFTSLTDIPFVSKRFILKTYLHWTEEQMSENERMWKEERSRLSKPQPSVGSPTSGLSDVGITSSGIEGMSPEVGDSDIAPENGETPVNNTDAGQEI